MTWPRRKLPDCPVCDEDELYFSNTHEGMWLTCYYCNWHSGIMVLDAGELLDDAIARIVNKAKKLPDWGEVVDYLLTLAPEPEPPPPEPPEGWEELDEDDTPHYDTPGGW